MIIKSSRGRKSSLATNCWNPRRQLRVSLEIPVAPVLLGGVCAVPSDGTLHKDEGPAPSAPAASFFPAALLSDPATSRSAAVAAALVCAAASAASSHSSTSAAPVAAAVAASVSLSDAAPPSRSSCCKSWRTPNRLLAWLKLTRLLISCCLPGAEKNLKAAELDRMLDLISNARSSSRGAKWLFQARAVMLSCRCAGSLPTSFPPSAAAFASACACTSGQRACSSAAAAVGRTSREHAACRSG